MRLRGASTKTWNCDAMVSPPKRCGARFIDAAPWWGGMRPLMIITALAALLFAQVGAAADVATSPACQRFSDLWPQIWQDFVPLAKHGPITASNVSELAEHVRKYNAHSYYFLEMAVVDGVLYLKGDPNQLGVWLKATVKLIAVALDRHGQWIPDVHFVLSVLDDPYLDRRNTKPLPLLSTLTTAAHWDIAVPAQAFFEEGGISSRNAADDFLKWDSDEFQAAQDTKYPWEERVQKAFFRGHDWESINSHIEDLPTRVEEPCIGQYSETSSFGYRRWYEELSQPGAELEDVIDVGLTGAPDFYKEKRKARPFAAPVSIPEHARFRYLLHLDGTAGSTRLVKLLTLGSVVLKQESPYVEYFYRYMKPYVDYVPIARDRCSYKNLTAAVEWLRKNDAAAQRIAKNGRKLQRRVASIDAASCYWQRLLAVYGALQAFEPRTTIDLSKFKRWPSRRKDEL
eukprot:TRINITY_DN30526_c0_g1_i1.p1 TRINITY_DN30526_c0_g1~~TRINITY_DN30526_c0_g1_i1.p1  ORF type:complete len:456 (+),score=93.35 TRINITY_DN30526_c0_g1_i1:95-1462(+)